MPEQGFIRITSRSSGILEEVLIKEGQIVRSGEALFTTSGERFGIAGGTQKIISEQLEQRLQAFQKKLTSESVRLIEQTRFIDDQLKKIEGEFEQFRDETNLTNRRVTLSKINLTRQEELLKSGFISKSKHQQAEGELLTLLAQQKNMARTRKNLDREHIALQMQRKEIELRHNTEVSEIDNSISMIKQEQMENDLRNKQITTAPLTGRITSLNVQTGQHIDQGTLLGSLTPEQADLMGYMYIPSQKSGFIQTDQLVLIRYSAYPYQKFGMARGVITAITKSPYATQELPIHIASVVQKITEPNQLYYRVTVKLESQTIETYGEPQPLQVGMLFDADVLQDERRLYEWVLEPIYSLIRRHQRSPTTGTQK
ncbi:HlyD family secretion protein [Pseudomonas fluorescens]|uniref:HlyD family secretion protein n=1 Tax=Pseudomonas fluorescens TaxID=294 RepID=UPI003F977AF1